MSEQNKIQCLQEHIQTLVEEISLIDLKDPKLSAEQHLTEKTKLMGLKNLRAIAKNELNSLLHQYKFTLRGKILNKGEISEKVVRTRVFTEFDCNVQGPATIKMSSASAPLIEMVQKDYSTYFLEGKFEIKRIKKVR
jgi:hypothetical protein